MKGLKQVSEQSKTIVTRNMATWLPVYYNIKEDTVRTTEAAGYFLVTKLIRANTEDDIKEVITQFLSM